MSPFISVTRRARRRPAPPIIAVLLATTVLLASFVAPAFGLSPTRLISQALSTAKRAIAEAKTADKDAKNSAVGTGRLRNGAITADKLAAGAVGNTQLGDNSVGANNLIAGSVGSATLADGAVTGSKLAGGAVGTSQLAIASVASANLANGAVTSAKLASSSVSIANLSGTSTSTTFNLPAVTANTCSTAEVPDAGAGVADFPMISFPGPVNLPLGLSATALRVDVAGSVRVKFCNGTSVDASAVTGVNVEVITLR
jgi:hypothetical protein